MTERLSRRSLLKTGFSLAGLAALRRVPLAGASPGPLDAPTAPVAIARCRRYDPAAVRETLAALFDRIGGVPSLISGKAVVIKVVAHPPSNIDSLPSFMTYDTHPEVVKAAARLFLDAGAMGVTVTESVYSRSGGAADFAAMGYDVAAFQHDLGAGKIAFRNCRNLEGATTYADRPVGSNPFLYDFFRLNRIFDFADGEAVFVSIAKMKHHQIAGVTLTLKNLFGMAPCAWYGQAARTETSTNARMGGFHDAGASYMGRNGQVSFGGAGENVPRVIVDLNRARPIHLAILDGVTMVHGSEGSWTRSPMGIAAPGVLIAGRNPVCVDAVGAAVLGGDPLGADYTFPWANSRNHIALAASKGIGTNDLAQIDVRGLPIADVRHHLPPTPNT